MMTDSLQIRQLDERSLPEIMALQETALAAIEKKEMLRRNSAEMLGGCLMEPHYAIGAYDGEQLAALAILYDAAGDPDEDLGHLLSREELRSRHCANFKLCIVHPDYRGYGLQQRLGVMIADEARRRGIALLCATVHPDNAASSRSLAKIGYVKDGLREKYGSVRELYFCDLLAQIQE